MGGYARSDTEMGGYAQSDTEVAEDKKCPYCGSLHIVKKGFSEVRPGRKKQRWKCRDCAKTFYHKEAED